MKLGVIAAALAGLAVTAWLVLHIGIGAVANAVASVGWGGFAILCAYALMLFVVLGTAWFSLMADLPLSRIATFVWGRIVRDAAGEVLPFSQFGGILIGVRALVLRGIAAPMAFASTIVDVTAEMVAQIIFIFVGISLFVLRFGMGGRTGELPFAILMGVVFAIAGSAAFVILQRRGLGLAERLAARFFPGAVKHAQSLSRDIEIVYRTPGRLAVSCAIHICGWFASAIGTWLAIRLIGGGIDVAGAIAIESILCALRSTAVVVPGALGIQEAGYALMLPLFGLPAEMGLAVSLLKRAREIVIGASVLLMWQGLEGRRAFATPDA